MFDRDHFKEELTNLLREAREVPSSFGVRVQQFAEYWLKALQNNTRAPVDINEIRMLMEEFPTEIYPHRPLDMKGPSSSSGTGKIDTSP